MKTLFLRSWDRAREAQDDLHQVVGGLLAQDRSVASAIPLSHCFRSRTNSLGSVRVFRRPRTSRSKARLRSFWRTRKAGLSGSPCRRAKTSNSAFSRRLCGTWNREMPRSKAAGSTPTYRKVRETQSLLLAEEQQSG